MPDGMEAFIADLDRGVATALVPGLIWVEAASVLLKKINLGNKGQRSYLTLATLENPPFQRNRNLSIHSGDPQTRAQ